MLLPSYVITYNGSYEDFLQFLTYQSMCKNLTSLSNTDVAVNYCILLCMYCAVVLAALLQMLVVEDTSRPCKSCFQCTFVKLDFLTHRNSFVQMAFCHWPPINDMLTADSE